MEARIFTGRRVGSGSLVPSDGSLETWEHREVAAVEVLVDGKPLELAPSLRLRRHSPTGFEWGYLGSGPASLHQVAGEGCSR